ncbi:MAG: hypothetical protein JWQ24_5665, partial [Tardiphaga sp.]|nr:hypothetical protein [Tardiphaga sp.]
FEDSLRVGHETAPHADRGENETAGGRKAGNRSSVQ